MSLLSQLTRLRLASGVLRAQVGKPELSCISSRSLRSGSKGAGDGASTNNQTSIGKNKQGEHNKNKRKLVDANKLKNNSLEKHHQNISDAGQKAAYKHARSNFFSQKGSKNNAAGGIHPTGYPSRDNTLLKERQSNDSFSSTSSCQSKPKHAKTVGNHQKSGSHNKHKPYNLSSSSGEGNIIKNFDNIKRTDTDGGIKSEHDRTPDGNLAGNNHMMGSVIDAVKQTGHNIMDKMSKVGEKTIEAGHNIAEQAKDAMHLSAANTSTLDINNLKAKHEPNLNRFSIKLLNNHSINNSRDNSAEDLAVLQYKKTGNNCIDYYHTEVPSNYRGNGIGAVLARAAFDYAADNHLKMKLSCSYLQDYLKKNPSEKYNRIVMDR